MAERKFDFVECIGRKKRSVSGSFATQAGAGTVASVNGLGFSVAYVTTGQYRITFEDHYNNLQEVSAMLQLASADDKFVIAGSYVAADKTLDLFIWDKSDIALADCAADANNRVHFECVFDDALQV